MANIPPYALTKPHVDPCAGLDAPSPNCGPEEIARRAQELINEWVRHYFTGMPFSSPGPSGQPDIEMTLTDCEILFGRATPTVPAVKPVLHTILADRRDGDGVDVGGGLRCFNGDWTWNTFVRVSPQTPAGTEQGASPDTDAVRAASQSSRRVGDQFAWLVRSLHAQDLVFKGFSNIRVLNGPRSIQSGAWALEQIVWAARVTWNIPG